MAVVYHFCSIDRSLLATWFDQKSEWRVVGLPVDILASSD